jgi:hypothetical protein
MPRTSEVCPEHARRVVQGLGNLCIGTQICSVQRQIRLICCDALGQFENQYFDVPALGMVRCRLMPQGTRRPIIKFDFKAGPPRLASRD